jgi:hypothetical protein
VVTPVQEDQLFRRDGAELFQERCPPLPIRFRVPLAGVERLFFRRKPIFLSTVHSEGTLTREGPTG